MGLATRTNNRFGGDIRGPTSGLVPETEYEQTRVRLAEGDLLILYTDGITECASKTDKELGFEGLRELLRSLPVEPPIVTASALLTAANRRGGV